MVLGAGVSVYKNELSKSISCYPTLNNWSSTKECNGTVSSCCLDLSPCLLHYFSFFLYCFPPVLCILLIVCPWGGEGCFQLSDRGTFHSLIPTSSGFSYVWFHTSPPIIIRNILGDMKNPCLTPEITDTRADGFPSCTIWQAKHQRLKIGTGIPNLVMVFHILLLAAESKAFSKSTETTGISSFISSWMNQSMHSVSIMWIIHTETGECNNCLQINKLCEVL